MTYKMYDSVSVGAMPIDGDVYASYVDHDDQNLFAQLVKNYPGKRYLSITNHGNPANAIDVENGSASIQQAVVWVGQRYLAREKPIVYCSQSNWPIFKQAFVGATEPYWWIANWSSDTTIPDGAIALQYASQAGYDTSSIEESYFTNSEDAMASKEISVIDSKGNAFILSADMTTRAAIHGQPDLAALLATGLYVGLGKGVLTDAFINSIELVTK